jgi:hypothetical protein
MRMVMIRRAATEWLRRGCCSPPASSRRARVGTEETRYCACARVAAPSVARRWRVLKDLPSIDGLANRRFAISANGQISVYKVDCVLICTESGPPGLMSFS